jgi:hypothetical protein
MISYDFLYNSIHDHFSKKLNIPFCYPNFDNAVGPLQQFVYNQSLGSTPDTLFLYYDQEPIDRDIFNVAITTKDRFFQIKNKILIHSEYSDVRDYFTDRYNMEEVHVFYHALLCHEWYRAYWYQSIDVKFNFTKTYITHNNLILDKRLYRANLFIELNKRGILNDGLVSFNSPALEDIVNSVNTYSLLPAEHKCNILDNQTLLGTALTQDTNNINGHLSAEIDVENMQQAFVNVVTETIYYENKVHLTEKIFKPIVAKMPFLLFAGAGNLAYLRKYGFKTFGDFWDESYDSINNNVDRFNAVMSILEDLCHKPHNELVELKKQMADILEYNYQHFYKTMRPIVVDEFTDNLGRALTNVSVEYNPADLANLNRILTY